MTELRDEDRALDTRLRRALDADGATVARLTRAALAGGAAAAAPRDRRWLLTAVPVAAALALVVWLARSPARRPVADAAVHISNHGEVLTVRDAAGNVWLRNDHGETLGHGPRLVILKGDSDG